MKSNSKFLTWSSGFAGCDGGDIGNPINPSIWVCGIEWGGGHNAEGLLGQINEEVSMPPKGYQSYKDNLTYRFNWQIIKLLSAINGKKVAEYKDFAREEMPFVSGSTKYFKMNLYPIAFKNTSDRNWSNEFFEITGFETVGEYLQWSRIKRFPKFRMAATCHKPRLIICIGKSYLADFQDAFAESNTITNQEIIDEKLLQWGFNTDGSLVVVVPFLVNRNGLVRNVSIQKFGDRIKELLDHDL